MCVSLNVNERKVLSVKWLIRSRKSKKEKHYNGQKKNNKQKNKQLSIKYC